MDPTCVHLAIGQIGTRHRKVNVIFGFRRRVLLTSSRWQRRKDNAGVNRGTFVSMGLIFALIFLFIPWQVAFLGCWIIHLSTCATSTQPSPFPGSSRTPGTTPPPVNILLKSTATHDGPGASPESSANDVSPPRDSYDTGCQVDNSNHNMHLLLVMTWLLPLAAPVLAVWVRTLITAGLTTPFDGDHNFLNIAPFLLLVDFASWYKGPLYETRRYVHQSFEYGDILTAISQI